MGRRSRSLLYVVAVVIGFGLLVGIALAIGSVTGRSQQADDGSVTIGTDAGPTVGGGVVSDGSGEVGQAPTRFGGGAESGSNDTVTTQGTATGELDGVSPADANCDTTAGVGQSIRFTTGEVSSTVEDVLGDGERKPYTLEVAEGQVLTVRASAGAGDVTVSVVDPDGLVVADGVTEVVETTVPGVYQICVGAGRRATDYSLVVSVVDEQSDPIEAAWCGATVHDRGEIRFAAGAVSDIFSGNAVRGEHELYRIGALVGQTMTVVVNSAEDDVVFALQSPTGEILVDDMNFFESPLLNDGDYAICVEASGGDTRYTAEVIIVD